MRKVVKRRRPAERSELRPREGGWSGEPRPLRRTARPVPGVWMPFVAIPALYGTWTQFSAVSWPFWMTTIAGFGLALWLALTIVWRLCETVALRTMREDRAFSDAPPGIVEHPMEIVLFDAGHTVGVDRGFAWFEDGLLTFNGVACSFALAAHDFYSRGAVGGRDYYVGVPRDALRLGTYGRTAYVRFRPLVGTGKVRFWIALRCFLRARARPNVSRQWPPLVPYGMTAKAYERAIRVPEAIGDEAARN